MVLSVSVSGCKPDGAIKDSGRNLMPVDAGGRSSFVVNLVSEHQANSMAKTGCPLPQDQSEFAMTGLEMIAAEHGDTPIVAGASAAFECRAAAMLTG